jgi:regulation of enolase protein 1 (concanavalin A-like superfamily)
MYKKMIYVVSFILVLGLAGSASASLPPGWLHQDIGTTGGSADESGGVWTVEGDGADIWDNADHFHFVYQFLEGDGEITARVVDVGTGSNNWAKAGVMIRETLDPGSSHAMEIVTPGEGSGIGLQWRQTTGGSSAWTGSTEPVVSPPYWVRIRRTGSLFEGFHSPDGINWEKEGDVTISMVPNVYIGLCRTSHASGEVRSATFDNVSYVGSISGPVKAYDPEPPDGAILTDTWVSMNWTTGYTAASHDVYFSDSLADVEAGAEGAFRGNQTSISYIVGFPGFPYPDGLDNGTTYYWRVDEVEADGTTIHQGDVWSFTVPSKKAYDPIPPDGGSFIDPATDLSFEPGFSAKLHTVYFGDNFDDVNNAEGGALQGDTTFDPGTLELETTYYWRVDEFDPPFTHKGDVWSFTTTMPGLGTIVQNVWNNLDTTDLNTLKDSLLFPNFPDETIILDEFSTAIDTADNYGGRITGWLYAPATGEYTFWLTTDDQGELWLSTDDDPENIRMIAYVKDSPTATGGWAASTEWSKYDSQKSDPVTLQAGNRYYIEALWKEAGGGDHCRVAWQGPGIPTRTIIPGTNLSPYEPVQAFGPNPGNDAVDISQTTDLGWKAGIKAASHEVYFGGDEDAVENATKSSPEFKGTRNLGEESYVPGKLDWDTAYYWRVDEVNDANPDSPWIGKTWSFTTADFLIVDDMESYNDLNPDEPGSNRIYLAWLDGYDNPAINGSIVGYNSPPFTEQTIVHGGSQSMPFFYDNSVGKSEATLTLTDVRDWTENSVVTLKIWYRGNPPGFVEDPEGSFTMSGAGTDIWDTYDEFRYAYRQLSGDGEMVARVVDVGTGSNTWAKAGVMIRETLDPDSKHAMTVITGSSGSGAAFQWRETAGSSSSSVHDLAPAVSPPHWVRIVRQGDTITGYVSPDGATWKEQGNTTVTMVPNVHIGLCLTSHASGEVRTAVFDNVQITGSVSLTWQQEAIGATMAANDPDAMYVALNGGTKVYNDNPNAAVITDWTEWNIDLQEFGVNLANVNTVTLGLDNSNNPAAGGSGLIFFDDIQLHRPAP